MASEDRAAFPPAEDFIGRARSLAGLKKALPSCEACDLHLLENRAVFGEGAAKARLMLVGEQPGDVEDREGRPFVGPAGKLLRAALEETGIDPARVWLTNAVKHFNFEPRGKRRLHKKPAARHVSACRPWLEHEIAALDPELVVCLGATAARSLMGTKFAFSKERGRVLRDETDRLDVLATYHPSYLLRLKSGSGERYAAARAAFIADLALAARDGDEG